MADHIILKDEYIDNPVEGYELTTGTNNTAIFTRNNNYILKITDIKTRIVNAYNQVNEDAPDDENIKLVQQLKGELDNGRYDMLKKYLDIIYISSDTISYKTYIEYFDYKTMDIVNNTYENYLFVNKLKEYSCCFEDLYLKINNLAYKYGLNGVIMRYLDHKISSFISDQEDYLDYVLHHNIDDNTSEAAAANQRKDNLSNKRSDIKTSIDNYVTDVKKGIEDIYNLFESTDTFKDDLFIGSKIIGLANIIFTMPESMDNLSREQAEMLVSYKVTDENGIRDKYHEGELSDQDRLTMRVNGVLGYTVQIILQYKEDLKEDYSNFRELLVQAVNVSLNVNGILLRCKENNENLDFFKNEEE